MHNKLFLLVLISVVLLGSFFTYQYKTSVCRNPIEYGIGTFDLRFNITRENFINTLKEAEDIWETDLGMDLLNYQPTAKFKINLVFDERQKEIIDATQSKTQIEDSQESYDAIVTQYNTLSAIYKRRSNEYDLAVNRFENRLKAYNIQVSEANKKGGASPEEYERLQIELKNLENIKLNLNDDRATLNSMASDLNMFSRQINILAGKLNIEVEIHNERFGEAREFDQGDYTGKEINIYQFDTIADLRLVLAHEFGHALDLDHVENPISIMYYLMDKQDLDNLSLTKEDVSAFREKCEINIPKLHEILGNLTHILSLGIIK